MMERLRRPIPRHPIFKRRPYDNEENPVSSRRRARVMQAYRKELGRGRENPYRENAARLITEEYTAKDPTGRESATKRVWQTGTAANPRFRRRRFLRNPEEPGILSWMDPETRESVDLRREESVSPVLAPRERSRGIYRRRRRMKPRRRKLRVIKRRKLRPLKVKTKRRRIKITKRRARRIKPGRIRRIKKRTRRRIKRARRKVRSVRRRRIRRAKRRIKRVRRKIRRVRRRRRVRRIKKVVKAKRASKKRRRTGCPVCGGKLTATVARVKETGQAIRVWYCPLDRKVFGKK